jgi:hypothetical protein
MPQRIIQGVQLPPDSTGKITAGVSITIHNDSTGNDDTVVIPATLIVDTRGYEIGTEILSELRSIRKALERLEGK